jgi:hypothetical protein
MKEKIYALPKKLSLALRFGQAVETRKWDLPREEVGVF